ncbi:MAG: hypothetical protein KDK41_13475 [Leptospiraceae bacterium]|nr:hypothetical protein [Leptospiraceae bacterium]
MKKTCLLLLILAASFLTIQCADIPAPVLNDAPANGILMVAGSDYQSGMLSAVSLYTRSGTISTRYSPGIFTRLSELFADTSLNYSRNKFCIAYRLGRDSIQCSLPAQGYRSVFEVSTGSGSNPGQVIWLADDRGVVILYGRNYLLMIDSSGNEIGRTDLSAFSDNDGLPEANSMYFDSGNNHLYVSVQRLNRNANDAIWPPAGQSFLLKYDTSGSSLVFIQSYQLPFLNPISRIQRTFRNTLVMAAPGRFLNPYTLDGGVIEFDLGSGTFLSSPLTEVQAGIEISSVVLISASLAAGFGYDSSLKSVFFRFIPGSGAITEISRNSTGFFSGLVTDSERFIYAGVRDAFNPGIRTFDGDNNMAELGAIRPTDLPPADLLPVE